ncbi:MAG: hypothetical protein ACOC0D_04275 [Spirochaeta sp.]
MDNERKIDPGADDKDSRELIDSSKMLFLQEVASEFRKRQEQYDVAAEFAKTKANRSPLVLLVILTLVAISAATVVSVHVYSERSAAGFQVSIDDFQDINLREVLDSVSRLENRLRELNQDQMRMEEEFQRRMRDVQGQAEREIELISSRSGNQGEQNRQAAQVRNRLQEQQRELQAEFDERMQLHEQETEEVLNLLSQYDTRQADLAQQQETVLDNQSQVHALEMEELRSRYEAQIDELVGNYEQTIHELESYQVELRDTLLARLQRERAELIRRFNPDLSETDVAPLVTAVISPSTVPQFELQEIYTQERIFSEADMRSLRNQYGAQRELLQVLQDVPYQNSVPDVLRQLENRSVWMVTEYERWLERAAQALQERTEQVAQNEEYIRKLLYAPRFMARSNRDHGYIINPEDPERIAVYVDSNRDPETGLRAFVFRADDQKIAEIELEITGGRQYARVVETVDGQEIQPFDTLLLQVQENEMRSYP